jgi:alkanesulfonate monooxygenase SsuD/methylene tetrahydromethanopterin reductase-like flavin-dependent oxidoreductase (luciferase family)
VRAVLQLKYGLSFPNAGPVERLIAAGESAERSGWDGVFFWDHIQLIRALRLDLHDPWVLLGALAHATSRVRLGALVTPLPRRRPWKFAREVTTLDHLSQGRAVVGAGLGFPPGDDFAAFGDEHDDRIRGARLDEALTLAAALWTGDDVWHHGDHFRADARFSPVPLQRPHPPVWIACSWPKRAGVARARHWQGIVPISEEGEPLPPAAIAEVVDALGPIPTDFDVVAAWSAGYSVDQYERVGATWLIESRWPEGDWLAELEAAAARDPHATS